jgi:hypothetical protein
MEALTASKAAALNSGTSAARRGGLISSIATFGTGVVLHQMRAAPVFARVWVIVRRFAE